MYLLLGGRGEGSVFFNSVFLIYHKDEQDILFISKNKKKETWEVTLSYVVVSSTEYQHYTYI